MSYLAIDIGGTNIKIGIVSEEGVVTEAYDMPTPRTNFEDLKLALYKILDWSRDFHVKGIGISQPCATDPRTGQCLSGGALIYILHQNIRDLVEAYSGLPAVAANDGNCAAIAELWIGGAKHVDDFAFVVCGTGIGGAVIINREIQQGSKLFAGEFGMMINEYDVESDSYNNWSLKGSTYAVIKAYADAVGEPESNFTGRWVFDAADHGNVIAEKCVKAFYGRFAVGVHNIQHTYDPSKVIIGGAIISRPDFITRLKLALDRIYVQADYGCSHPQVEVSVLGHHANLIGAVFPLIKG
jgi:glucokinase